MKRLQANFLLILITVSLATCKKNKLEVNPLKPNDQISTPGYANPDSVGNVNPNKNLDDASYEDDYDREATVTDTTLVYRYNGEIVSSTYFSLSDTTLWFVISLARSDTNATSGRITINAFTTKSGYEYYGDTTNLPLALWNTIAEHLSNYADTSGAIEEYNETGEVPEWYFRYESDYIDSMERVASTSNIFKDYSGGASAFVYKTLPVMYPGWNNTVSRYKNLGLLLGMDILYNSSFYKNLMGTFRYTNWTTVKFEGPLVDFNDKASSWFTPL